MRGMIWWKEEWASARVGEPEVGQMAGEERNGARMGSRRRVGRVSAKEARKQAAADRTGSGRPIPPKAVGRRAWKSVAVAGEALDMVAGASDRQVSRARRREARTEAAKSAEAVGGEVRRTWQKREDGRQGYKSSKMRKYN